MSTTNQGDAFEARVLAALSQELRSNRLGFEPAAARLTPKRRYYSKDRAASICVDIALELYLQGAQEPSVVWVFECKDYHRNVSVNEIEQFHSVLQQIGADRTKGTLVITGSVQKSALALARSWGIGIVRLLPDGQLLLLLHLRDDSALALSDPSEVLLALTSLEHRSDRSFFAIDGEQLYADWSSYLSNGLRQLLP